MSNLEKNCTWHFAKQLGGREDGPNDPMQENFKKTPYASLIRESIQNSLDVALDDSQPVRMEFSISRIRARNYSNFFELRKHIQGCMKHFSSNKDAKRTYQPMLDYLNSLGEDGNLYYIKVSDFNTKGMSYVKGDTDQPFYAFVRAAGVSSKSDTTAGGSFGYGKAAYFYISPLRTIIVSTQTKDGHKFFEGVSSLCTHELEGDDDLRVSVGYYDNNNGEPVTNPDDIPDRFQRTEPGTDIFILGIDARDKLEIYREMVEAVIRNFWLAIELNKLEVKISDPNATPDSIYPCYVITHDTLSDFMDMCFPETYDQTRRERGYNPRPYWEAVRYANIDKNHKVFEADLPVIGHIRFYAYKIKKAEDKILYMRRPCMLVKAQRTQSSYGFYGVFVCDDEKGNELLRKTENPAHDEWSPKNWRDERGKIVKMGTAAIEDIEQFTIKVRELMFPSMSNTIQQIQGLEEFLYIPTAIEDDDDFVNESLVGDVVDQKDEEGNAISTIANNPAQTPQADMPAIGKVMITDPVMESQKLNPQGGHLSGHGTRKKKNRGGGGLSPRQIDGHFGSDVDGIQGNMLTEIPVRYRVFAQVENGQTIHNIVVHSDCEIENGRIDLLVGGEQADDIVSIEKCLSGGIIEANTISGLHILNGKNVIKVKFADNMKHAVKLDAYELK